MNDEAAELAEAERALEAPGQRRMIAKDELRRADDELRPLVFKAVQAGVSIRRIAAKTGLSTTTVMLWGRG
ncbi:hypothetical protein [Streptomyces olivaceus]|jgi:hypothetical protein|uniref:hypothetical protein n=1 Tax=Streptomyces olivaceus TaxID=47716 RepID=UPI001CCB6926|nr:hypothetical protein [Streptomyces olivaceus]MBZ6212154.1 hypothetical protein [Streptomyces olivaceus]MBZ6323869.1 hypothetical protein [Streptomyces olivaceus]